ncbi:MAG: transcription-repair coupling factor [Leptospirillia bacterium]
MRTADSSLIHRLTSGDLSVIGGVPASAAAHLIARLQQTSPAPTLVLLAEPDPARDLSRDMALFTGLMSVPEPLHFPAWETLPHEFVSPLAEVSGQRNAVLLAAAREAAPTVVASVPAVLHRVPEPATLTQFSLALIPGRENSPNSLADRLASMGYRPAPQVEQPGQYTMRGDILDVFCPHLADPCRIAWFGDEVESVRHFDPVNQRSTGELSGVVVPPVTELPHDPEMVARARARVLEIAAGRGLDEASVVLETGRLDRTPRTNGIETWAPFFFETPMVTVIDHLPPDARVVLVDSERVHATARGLLRKAEDAMADEAARGTIVPAAEDLFIPLERLIKDHPTRCLNPEGDAPARWQNVAHIGFGPIEGEDRGNAFAGRFTRLGTLAERHTVTLTCPDAARAAAFAEILREHGIPHTSPDASVDAPTVPGQVRLITGLLSRGFAAFGPEDDPVGGEVFLSEAEFFGRGSQPPPAPHSRLAHLAGTLSDLGRGDAVVHLHHGIGIYRGVTPLTVADVTADFMELEYLGGDRVYVPMDRLDLVQIYAGGESVPKLDRMGGKSWERTKGKVRKALTTLAAELVELAAAREVAKGHSFAPEGADGVEFAASFPFTETPDQMRAIEETRADMERPRPMDRLICGDVGYGKTEVALRAAFKAMLDGRQVVFLVPTTLLAQQHFKTCIKRFAPYPFVIRQISRFVPAKDQKDIFAGLENGAVDMVIATHRLLTKEVPFKRLGLLVVDEEQRFGVTHKERIKTWKTQVDVLTLTATPIPRTLQLSLIGVRDLSIIDTPPPDRRAITTRVTHFEPTLIAEAIERELARNGQIFFIHNRVKDIGGMANHLQRLVPKAKICVGHGQMPERKLEDVMKRFIDGEADVLLSTSIVESGLDIPRANTIIINRADHFGLSELYQLRGRVGRSGRQAYAYLLGPETGGTAESKERLIAIQAFTELGSGFRIAARDLEIRGAGSLLGHKQSGQIAQVGIDTYMGLIKEAMADIRGETLESTFETTVKLGSGGAIPEDYVADSGVRLTLYKRLSGFSREAELEAFTEEMKDRFGPLPEATQALLAQSGVRILARRLRITEVTHLGEGRYRIVFDPDNTLSEVGLRMLLTEYGPNIRFTSEHAFELDLGLPPHAGGTTGLMQMLAEL